MMHLERGNEMGKGAHRSLGIDIEGGTVLFFVLF